MMGSLAGVGTKFRGIYSHGRGTSDTSVQGEKPEEGRTSRVWSTRTTISVEGNTLYGCVFTRPSSHPSLIRENSLQEWFISDSVLWCRFCSPSKVKIALNPLPPFALASWTSSDNSFAREVYIYTSPKDFTLECHICKQTECIENQVSGETCKAVQPTRLRRICALTWQYIEPSSTATHQKICVLIYSTLYAHDATTFLCDSVYNRKLRIVCRTTQIEKKGKCPRSLLFHMRLDGQWRDRLRFDSLTNKIFYGSHAFWG